MREKIIKKNFV